MPKRGEKSPESRIYYRDAQRAYRAGLSDAGKARVAKYHRAAYDTPDGRAARLYRAAKVRARKSGLEFTITLDDVLWPLLLGKCSITGAQFDLSKTDTRRNPWAPSMDRKDNAKGYTRDNLQVVCAIHNMAKNEWPESVLRQYVMMYASVILVENGILKR